MTSGVTETDLWALATRQLALVSWRQGLALVGRRQMANLIAAGRLERVRHGVYRTAGAPAHPHEAVMAACLGVGQETAVSHVAAGALWGMRGLALGVPELLVAAPTRLRLPGVVVHHTTLLPAEHVATRGSIPVTTPARTIFDLSAVVSPWLLARIMDESVRRRRTTYDELRRCAEVLAARGRRRLTVVRAVLAGRGPEYHPGDSDPEVDIVSALLAAGLPPPAQQHQVVVGGRVFLIDVAYPEIRLGIEYDSDEFHSDFSAREHDRLRDRVLIGAGWTMLHFGHGDSLRAVVRDVEQIHGRLLATAVTPAVHQREKVGRVESVVE